MNKRNFIFSALASAVIPLVSLPIVGQQNVINAEACVNFQDSFSTNSGKWFFEDTLQTPELKDGKMILKSSNNSGEYYVYYAIDSPHGDYSDWIYLTGDWTMQFDIGPITENFVQAENEYIVISNFGLQLLSFETGADSFNIFIEKSGVNSSPIKQDYRPYFYYTSSAYADNSFGGSSESYKNGEATMKVVKSNGTFKTYVSFDGGFNFTLLNENPAVGNEHTLRFYTETLSNSNYLTYDVEYSLDNFYITCPGSPEPQPVKEFVEYPVNSVYRFYNLRTRNTHFYTIEKETAQFVYDNSLAGGLWPNVFSQEVPTFSASYYQDGCIGDSVPVKRYRNILEGDTHFYAIKAEEIDAVENQFSDVFEFEEIAFCAGEIKYAGTVPVYRWVNTKTGTTHFYTADQEEIDYVNNNLADTFSPEGIAFYAYPM